MTWLARLFTRRRQLRAAARELDLALALRRRGRAQRQARARKGWETRREQSPLFTPTPHKGVDKQPYPQSFPQSANVNRTSVSFHDSSGGA